MFDPEKNIAKNKGAGRPAKDVISQRRGFPETLTIHANALDKREAELLEARDFLEAVKSRDKIRLKTLRASYAPEGIQQSGLAWLWSKHAGAIPLELVQIWLQQAQEAAARSRDNFRLQSQPILEKVIAATEGSFGYVVDQELSHTDISTHLKELRKTAQTMLNASTKPVEQRRPFHLMPPARLVGSYNPLQTPGMRGRRVGMQTAG